jgi:hypothetical protein
MTDPRYTIALDLARKATLLQVEVAGPTHRGDTETRPSVDALCILIVEKANAIKETAVPA